MPTVMVYLNKCDREDNKQNTHTQTLNQLIWTYEAGWEGRDDEVFSHSYFVPKFIYAWVSI